MKKLFAKLIGWKYVALLDFDGEVTFRIARPTPFGLVCDRMVFGLSPCLLIEGGRVIGPSFVKKWMEAA